LPAFELLVYHLTLLEEVKVGREVVELVALGALVGDRDLEGGEGVEDVEFCETVSNPPLQASLPISGQGTYSSGSTPCSS
jgi:hypothetical protein